MAIHADWLCFGVLGAIFITSVPTLAERQADRVDETIERTIQKFEGFHACPYQDTGGQATIGYGNSFYPDGKPVRLNDPCITKDRAKQMMQAELDRLSPKIEKLVKVPITQNQKTALTSFAFNVGIEALKDSALLRKLNAGDQAGAAAEFDLWVHGDGERLPGLVERRKQEKQLFQK